MPGRPEEERGFNQLDTLRADEIVRIVRASLEDSSAQRTPKTPVRRFADALKNYWALVLAVASLLLAMLGWVVYGVSPLNAVQEIAYRQQQRGFQRELVERRLALGNDFLDVGQLPAAKAEFTRVRELDPYNVAAEIGLLKVAVFEPIVANDYSPEVADRRLKAILRHNSSDTHALTFLGEVYRAIDANAALQYYERALVANPNNALAYFGKGVLLDVDKQREAALAMYDKAASLSPWNQTFLNNLAYQHFLLEDYEKAEQVYVQLLTLDPRFLLSHYMLAHSQLLRGQEKVAIETLQTLDQLLGDETTASLPRNAGGWFFHAADGDPIYLFSQDEKRAYASYVLALAKHVLSREGDAIRDLTKARLLNEGASRAVIVSDILRLRTARPALAGQLEMFNALVMTE